MEDPRRDPFALVGTTLADKYRVESVIGEGGFGVVYRGVHVGFEEPIAIKCLKLPAHLSTEEQIALVEQLRAEGRVLFRLSQRTSAIVQAIDVGTHLSSSGARVPYLVLQWLEGKSLAADLLARRKANVPPRSVEATFALLDSAARALAIAHEEKVAHRDIKPENLMLVSAGSGTVKVLDFGIAKVLEGASSAQDAKTSAAPAVLTAGYAAPEQYEKARGASGPWSDVFALAIVFLEVASQRRAIAGPLLDAYRATVDEHHRPSLAALGVPASAEVEAVLQKALAIEPRARYRNAKEFWEALEAALPIKAAAALPSGEPELSTAEFVQARGLAATVDTADQRGAPALGDAPLPAAPSARPLELVATAPTERATTKAAVSLGGEAPATVAPPRRGWLVGAAMAAAAVAGVVLLRPPPAPTSPSAGGAALSTSAGSPTSASPPSSIPEAAALFQEANEAWRSGSPDSAVDAMERAVKADRALAAGQLRLSLWKLTRKPADAREHFDAAQRHKQALGPRDLALLEAAVPLMNVPEDAAAYESALGRAASQFETDADLWALLAQVQNRRLRYREAMTSADRALALDDKHVASWVFRGDAQAGLGDSQARLATYERCVQLVPRAFECLNNLVSVHAILGDCNAMLDVAKRFATVGAKSPRSHRYLAIALFATRADPQAVLEALNKSWSLMSDRERARAEPRDRATLAILQGDFVAAQAELDKWSKAVAGEADQNAHLEPALIALELLREMGLAKEAATRADGLSRRMGGWQEPTVGDWSLTLARFRLFGGKLTPTEFAALREPWSQKIRGKWEASGRKTDGELEWTQWVTGYGAVVTDKDSALLAVQHIPKQEVAAFASGRYASVDVTIGRARAAAGQGKEAAAPLLRALKNCSFPLSDPLLAVSGEYWLGVALESQGDLPGARAAYQRVVDRWGAAKPKALTAEAAAKRLAVLP